jgi:N-acetylglucosaminyldiphosphoundecaprenol N-acetyl-beta-D-mannosaminyltransferase
LRSAAQFDATSHIYLPRLRVRVAPITLDGLAQTLASHAEENTPTLVVGQNLHSTYLATIDRSVSAVYSRANLVLADGFPIWLASRIFSLSRGSASKADRIGSTDWIPRLAAQNAPLRVFVIGASASSNSEFCSRLSGVATNWSVKSFSGQNWSESKASEALRIASQFRPNLTFIGLGMPLQEQFIDKHLHEFQGVVALVGGAIDQLSGTQRNCPRWLGKLGLEWLWRLVSQPKRLAFRYLVEPWLLVWTLVKRPPNVN